MSQSPKQDFDPRTHLIEALCESPMDEDEVYPRVRTYDRLLDEVLEERRRASRSGNLCTALVGVVTAIGASFAYHRLTLITGVASLFAGVVLTGGLMAWLPEHPGQTTTRTASTVAPETTGSIRDFTSSAPRALAPGRTFSSSSLSLDNRIMIALATDISEARARATYEVMQARFPDVLTTREPVIEEVEADQAYRIEIGPFATVKDAFELCRALRREMSECVILKDQ